MDARRFPPESDDIATLCPAMFPYMDNMTFRTVVPNDTIISAFLTEDFLDMLVLTRDDPVGLLKTMPPEMVSVCPYTINM